MRRGSWIVLDLTTSPLNTKCTPSFGQSYLYADSIHLLGHSLERHVLMAHATRKDPGGLGSSMTHEF